MMHGRPSNVAFVTPNEGSEFGKRTDPNEGNEYAKRGTPNEGNQFGNRTETAPKTNPNTEFKTNPFGNERRDNPNGNTDDRLSRYLVGTWNGRLNNGQVVKVAFASNGGFAIAMNGSDVVQVGRYTVSGGVIRLQLHSRCSLTTKRCQRFDQVRATTIGFRPLNASSFQVQDGVLHRAA